MKRSAMIALGAGFAVAPRIARAQTLKTLRIGVLPSDFAAQVYYANDLGMFAKAGYAVEFTPMRNGPAVAAAVISGSLDFGYSNILSLAVAHGKAFPFMLIASANMYSSAAPTVGLIGVKASGPVMNAHDLIGKVMGVGSINNITHIGAMSWMDATGGDSTKVKYIELSISELAPAILANRIDAGVMDQGVYPTLGKSGDPIRVIAHSFDTVGSLFCSGGWFTTADWIAKHPMDAKKVAAVLIEAGAWGNTHHRESAAIVAKYVSGNADEINATTRVEYGTALTPALLQAPIDAAAKYKAIKTTFPARELIAAIPR